MTDQTTIERLAIAKAAVLKGSQPKKKRVGSWVQPVLDDLAYGTVLAFDQASTKTGFCLLTHRPSGITVHRHGKLVEPPVPDLKGFEDDLQRATWMAERTENILVEAALEHPTLVVVHEMPAVRGPRSDSSKMAALGVRLACSRHGYKPTMVNKQHVAAVLCPPDDRDGKPAIGRAVQHLIDAASREWNQDSRDAAALALTYLYDRKKRAA